jgi:8-oxo-dGTP pyrophosphatase MutT (NUDIX family)
MTSGVESMPREVAKTVLIHEGRALILRLESEEREKRGIDEWHVPGGSREPEDVDIEDAATRETLEETGLKVTIVRKLGEARWEAFYNGKPASFKADFFESKLEDGQTPDMLKLDKTEADDYAWIKVSDFDAYPALTDEAKKFISMVLVKDTEN